MPKVDVLIIGAGATGAGIARDLSMRGASVVLVDRGDFCSGASGSNHGMLHSGARYAVKDSEAARECAVEANILRKIAAPFIEDIGGLFVSLPEDDFGFAEKFKRGCAASGVEARELEVTEALEIEPSLNGDIVRAYLVEDGSIDPFGLILANIEDSREKGAKARNYCEVVGFDVKDFSIEGVNIKDHRTGAMEIIKARVVVNAAGAWAAKVAAMAEQKLALRIDKGSMVVLNGRVSRKVVNRLRSPSDGDIIIPNHSSSIIGTTSTGVTTGDGNLPTETEVMFLVRETAKMIPGIIGARAIRAYSGVRPLIQTGNAGRTASRNFKVVDHANSGIDNLVSVIGGKLTTYRLMAEKVSDVVLSKLGISARCRTGKDEILEMPTLERVEGIHDAALLRIAKKSGIAFPEVIDHCLSHPRGTEEVCTCERVLRGEIQYHIRKGDVFKAPDLTRRTRCGMGYCQGGMCAMGVLSASMNVSRNTPVGFIEGFLNEREKGSMTVMTGEQLRQEMFKAHLLRRTYGVGGDRR